MSRDSKSGKVVALAFNYPDEFEQYVPAAKNFDTYMNASSKHLDLCLTGLKPGTVFEIETLDKENGNVFDDYVAMGKPHSPTREEILWLKQQAWGTKKEMVKVGNDGKLVLKREIAPWACVLIKEL